MIYPVNQPLCFALLVFDLHTLNSPHLKIRAFCPFFCFVSLMLRTWFFESSKTSSFYTQTYVCECFFVPILTVEGRAYWRPHLCIILESPVSNNGSIVGQTSRWKKTYDDSLYMRHHFFEILQKMLSKMKTTKFYAGKYTNQ